jgi:triosephosphate isomerase
MRTPFVAGNWKMNKNVAEARVMVAEMAPVLRAVKGVEKVLCPPFMCLVPVAALLQGTDIGLGAQNIHWEAKGAYTGEVAAGMVAEFCHYVIIGHSERRTYFGETDETVNKKTVAARTSDRLCGRDAGRVRIRPDGGSCFPSNPGGTQRARVGVCPKNCCSV